MSLKLRRGTNAERLQITPDVGELIYTTDTKRLYAGDGVTLGGTLVSYEGSVQGALGGNLVMSGYNITGDGNIDITGTINSGNINVTGSITASGTITANGNIVLGNADTDNVSFGAEVNSHFVPNFGNTYDLGSDTKSWRKVYADYIFGEFEGNVRAQDSTLLVDSVQGVLRGQLFGSVSNPGQLAVSGNVNGNVVGDVTGSVKAGNGIPVLENGTDGTDAVFTGNVIGNLTGTVTNGLLSTETYYNPSWIGSVGGEKIYGTLNGVLINGDVFGSVFSDDSTMLVDSQAGVLRGTHVGTLVGSVDTGDIIISNSTITCTNTNGDLTFETTGTGTIASTATIKSVVSNNTLNSFEVLAATDFQTFDGSGLKFTRSRGTQAAKTSVQDQDEIGVVSFNGLTGSGYSLAANIIAKVEGTVSDGVVPGLLELNVTDTAGTGIKTLTLFPTGVIGFTSPTLTAGVGSGQVDTTSVATYMKVNIGGVEYAIPAYAINP